MKRLRMKLAPGSFSSRLGLRHARPRVLEGKLFHIYDGLRREFLRFI